MSMLRLTSATASGYFEDKAAKERAGLTMLIAYYVEVVSTLLMFGLVAGIALEILVPTVGSYAALHVSRVFLVVAGPVGLVTVVHSIRILLRIAITGVESEENATAQQDSIGCACFNHTAFQISNVSELIRLHREEHGPSLLVLLVIIVPSVLSTALVFVYDVILFVLAVPAKIVAYILACPGLCQRLRFEKYSRGADICQDGRRHLMRWTDTYTAFPAVTFGLAMFSSGFALYVVVLFWYARSQGGGFAEFLTFTFNSASRDYAEETGHSHAVVYLLCLLSMIIVTLLGPIVRLARKTGIRSFLKLLVALMSAQQAFFFCVLMMALGPEVLDALTETFAKNNGFDAIQSSIQSQQPGKGTDSMALVQARFALAWFHFILLLLMDEMGEEDSLIEQLKRTIETCGSNMECMQHTLKFIILRRLSILSDLAALGELMFRL